MKRKVYKVESEFSVPSCKRFSHENNGKGCVTMKIRFNDSISYQEFIEWTSSLNLYISNDDYEKRIKKALKYIKEHKRSFSIGINGEIDEFDYISTSPNALEKILNGVSND